MGKRRSADQIQRHLREIESDRAKGLRLGDCCRKLAISQNTYHCWRRRCPTGGRRRWTAIAVTRRKVLSLYLDFSTATTEEVVLFTPAKSPDFREPKKKEGLLLWPDSRTSAGIFRRSRIISATCFSSFRAYIDHVNGVLTVQ